MPKGGLEDYVADNVTEFVLRWNIWSTAPDRQQIYDRAWAADHKTALGFTTALAADQKDHVPAHTTDYLSKHEAFPDTFLKAFKRVRKQNWVLGAVVNQSDFSFPPAVIAAENGKARIVMLYVIGDPRV